MAHPVELVLKLDSQDAERVLKDLQRKADAVKSAGSSGADELSNAMRDVRAAIVASGGLKAVDDLTKSFHGVGQKAKEGANKIMEVGSKLIAAAAAGGPPLVALVGGLMGLSYTFDKLSKSSEEFNRRLEEQMKIRAAARQGEQGRQQRRADLEQSYGEYQAKRREDRLLESGNWGAQVDYLDRLRKRRAALVEQAEAGFSDETDYRGSRAAEEGMEALEEVKELDAAIKRFEDALKKSSDQIDKEREAREKERKRLEEEQARRAAELQGARQRWDFGREADEARENGNVQWIQSQMALARERMGGAQDAQQFNQAASDFQRLESALKQVEETQRKKAEEEQRAGAAALQERFKQLTGVGSAVSDYTAAGFSMGENFGPLDGISRDVQEIVRLMQESAWRSKAAGATLY